VPLIHFNNVLIQFFQDFMSPFYLFTKANFTSLFTYVDNVYAPQNLMIRSSVETKLVNYSFKKISYDMELKNHRLDRFIIHQKTVLKLTLI